MSASLFGGASKVSDIKGGSVLFECVGLVGNSWLYVVV